MSSLEKTVVLVTGGNQGIGFDTCARLAAAPAYHVIMGSRSVDKGIAAVKSLQARNFKGGLSLVQLDVTNPSSISAAAERVEKDYGKLDVLVNNAGIVSTASTLVSRIRETLETNTIAPAAVTEAFLPLLKKSSNPRLIYVTSGLGSIEMKRNPRSSEHDGDYLAYRMSKASLNMLAVCHYRTFSEWGCKVWTYCPGFVVTNLTGEADRENRIKRGARSSEESAEGIMAIVEGKRDSENGGYIHKDGTYPW